MIRRVIYGIGGIAITLVLVFLAFPRLVDLEGFKPRIAEEFRKATGRTLALDGELDIDFVPYPRLAASDVRVLNSGEDAAFELVTLKAFRLGVRLLPLLRGEIEISDIEIVEPLVRLERLPDGRGNWQAAPRSPFDPPPAAREEPASGADLRINSLRIRDGALSYRDAAGAVERIDGVTADVTAGSLAGPFTVRGAMTVRRHAVAVEAYVGRHVEGEPLAVSLRAVSAGDTAALSAKGHLDLSGAEPRLFADAALKGPSLGAFLAALPAAGPPAGFDHPFSVAATVDADGREMRLANMSVTLGGVNASGTATIPLGGAAAARISLDAGRLDIDALAGMVRPPRTGADGAAADAVRLPTDVDLEMRLAAEEAVVARRPVRDLRMTVALRDGEVSVSRLSARLPGDAALELSAAAAAHRGRLEYRGTLSLRASEARPLLAWMGVDAAAVAEDRLRRLSARAEIAGDLSEIRFSDLRGQLDASNLSGGVTLALSRRPSFGANLSIDQLNLDGYAGGAREPAAAPGASGAGEAAAPGRGGVLPAVLGEFDANVALRVGTLRYRGMAASGVRLDGTLRDGALTIREASVRSLAGASFRFRGALANLAGTPEASASLAAAADDPGPLARIPGLEALAGLAGSGPLRLSARAGSVPEGLEIDGTLEIAGATVAVAGTGPPLGALIAGSFDGGRELRLAAQHPDPARLAALVGGAAESGAGEIRASLVATRADGAIGIRGEARFDGGRASVSGRLVEPLASPGFDVEADLRHPDLVRLVRLFDADFAPFRGDFGGVFVEAALEGDGERFSVDRLKGSVGAVDIAGSGSYRSDGPRPRVDLTLSSGLVPVDDFSGKSPPGAVPPGEAAAEADTERWSRAPFDAELLRGFDSRIELQARALLHGSLRVDAPRLVATLEDGVLSVEEMTGTVSGGAFRATGTVDIRDLPAARASLTVDGARVEAPLFETGAFDIVAGELDLDVDLEARGRSEHEMVRTLDGSGRFSVRNGRVSGLDLGRVGEAVEDPDPSTDLAGLLETAMSGGETAFSALDGSFDLERGIARVGTLGLRMPAASGTVEGRVDLPRWDVDMEAEYRLADPDDAPAFRMRLVGPPDRPRRIPGFQDLLLWALARGVERVPEPEAPAAAAAPVRPASPEAPAQPPETGPAPPAATGVPDAASTPKPAEEVPAPPPPEVAAGSPEAVPEAAEAGEGSGTAPEASQAAAGVPGAASAPKPVEEVPAPPPSEAAAGASGAVPEVAGAGEGPGTASAPPRPAASAPRTALTPTPAEEIPTARPAPPEAVTAPGAESAKASAPPTAPAKASGTVQPDPQAGPEAPETASTVLGVPPPPGAPEPAAGGGAPGSGGSPDREKDPQFDPDKLIRDLLGEIR